MHPIKLPPGINSAAEYLLEECDDLRKELRKREETLRSMFKEVLEMQGLDPENYRFDREYGALTPVEAQQSTELRQNHGKEKEE